MGFRQGAYATVWEVESVTDTMTKARISVSRKNKDTERYEQDFGGFVIFSGTAAAAKAKKLKMMDRIKLGDVDVTNRYVKDKGREYTDFKVFSFDIMDRRDSAPESVPDVVDAGEVLADDNELPF